MFKFEEICQLIRLVSSSKVASVEVEHAGTRIRIESAPSGISQPAAPPAGGGRPTALAPETDAAVVDVIDATEDSDESPAEEQLHWISSPIVGTFYRSPNPDSDPYVKVGDFVESGQTLCIVEAMKLMNEIESDAAGTIVKVNPENAQPVEYGELLFGIRRN
jgi:acetyl-CoA carboxylase biotin carboxyl carrier protein